MKSRHSSSIKSEKLKSSRDREHRTDFRFYQAKLEFGKELCDACTWFDCGGVYVVKSQRNDDYYKSLKATQKKPIHKQMSVASPGALTHPEPSDAHPKPDDVAGHAGLSDLTELSSLSLTEHRQTCLRYYRVESIYDAQNELVELLISDATTIPRVLMQCITLLSPHFRYLTKFSIVKSNLNGYALLELKNMLHLSHLTEIVLDKSILLDGSYAVLLENTPKLRYLSLVSCGVSDEVVGDIASNIDASISPFSNLALLNLSSNQLSDAAVQRLAQALKTNRSLRYLNLANNRITDAGAMPLLDVFKEFPLRNDDIVAKRRRYCVYWKERLTENCFKEESDTKSMIEESIRKAQKSATPSLSPKKSKKNSSTLSLSSKKSKRDPFETDSSAPMSARADSEFKPFNDPYSPERLKLKDDLLFCIGNFVLCYLNLSYNNLTYLTVKKLETVMFYQRSEKKTADLGLLKVLIDGNPMPKMCAEYNTLSQLMVNSMFRTSQSISHAHDGHLTRKSILQRTVRK